MDIEDISIFIGFCLFLFILIQVFTTILSKGAIFKRSSLFKNPYYLNKFGSKKGKKSVSFDENKNEVHYVEKYINL